MSRNGVSRALYRAARLSRDVRAIGQGPAAYGRRSVRRVVYRQTNKTVAGFLRKIGL